MENVNKIVSLRTSKLKNSSHTFKDIFDVMFLTDDYIFGEYNDGYNIYNVTYKECKEKIFDLAYSINQKYKDLKDSYIGIAIESTIEWVYIFWAIIASGNKPYLINLRHPISLVNNILKSLDVKYVIGNISDYSVTLININELDLKWDLKSNFNFSNEMALSTSATTLKEKIIFYNGEEITNQILNCNKILKENKQIKKHYKGRLKQLVFLPLYHIFGFMATFMWFSFFGRTMVFLSDYSSNTILRTIRKHEVTHIFSVPLFWETIYKEILKKVKEKKLENKFNKGIDLSIKIQSMFKDKGPSIAKMLMKEVTDELFGKSVMFCISGGAYIKDDVLRVINGLGYPLYNGYGMSEIGITSVELGDIKDRLKNSIGHPFESIEYRIMDSELYVYGSSISHKMKINGEYIYNKDLFKTMDVVKKDKQNNYYILGRKDDLYIGENGENISPDTLEKEYDLKRIKDMSILSLENKLSMVIQIDKYLSKNMVKDIYDEVIKTSKKLDMSYRISKIYFTYDNLKADTAIKVSRQYLKKKIDNNEVELFKIEDIKENKIENINQEILKIVKDEICNTLGIDNVLDDQSFFFDLGGNSLDYFSLISKLNDIFNISITFEENKNYHTALELTKRIEELI